MNGTNVKLIHMSRVVSSLSNRQKSRGCYDVTEQVSSIGNASGLCSGGHRFETRPEDFLSLPQSLQAKYLKSNFWHMRFLPNPFQSSLICHPTRYLTILPLHYPSLSLCSASKGCHGHTQSVVHLRVRVLACGAR
jgi:hypothetical protein